MRELNGDFVALYLSSFSILSPTDSSVVMLSMVNIYLKPRRTGILPQCSQIQPRPAPSTSAARAP